MPDAGPWTQADVTSQGTRPGFYANFQQAAASAVLAGERGVVGIISEADWGPSNEIVEITSMEDAAAYFTDTEDATARLYNLIRLAFLGGAQTIKACRAMNSTNAAKSTLHLKDPSSDDVLDFTAKYFGTYGDNISLDVGDDPVDSSKTRIRVYVEGSLVHSVTTTVGHGDTGFIDNIVEMFDDLDSEYVVVTKIAAGDEDLADVSSGSLADGANGNAVSSTEFTTCLNQYSSNEIHLLTTDTVNAPIQAVVAAWVLARREEGYRVIAVMGSDTGDSATTIITDAQGFNYEGVVYVGGGAVMPNVAGDSTTYNGAAVAAMVAGIIAGIPAGISPTFHGITTSTDVETNFTSSQIVSMLAAGACVITTTPAGSARIERGITTLYNPGAGDIAAFSSIRTMRIVDGISSGIGDACANTIIGRQLNDEPGRAALIDAIKDFLGLQQEQRNVQPGWTAAIDESQNNSGGIVFVKIGITPIDSIEKIFSTITLN